MSIFVTGATGFLGSHLVRQLLAAGHTEITALRRANSKMDLIGDVQDRVNWIVGDLLDAEALTEGIRGKKWVFHVAATISFSPRDTRLMQQVNAEGTALLVNTCLHEGIGKLLHVSSIAAVGRTKPQQTLHEKNIFQASPYNTDYGLSKFLGEQEVWRGIAEGLDAVIVNPAVIIGPGRWDEGTGQFFSQIARGFRYYPSGLISIVDVRDVARMLIQLAESKITEERFIANAGELSYQAFFAAIAQQLKAPIPQRVISPWLGELAWRLAGIQSLFTGKAPALTKESIRQSALHYVFDASKSKTQLQFQYTPIEQTIAETSRAFLQGLNA